MPIFIESIQNCSTMAKTFTREHIIIYLNDEGAEEICRRIDQTKQKTVRTKRNEWRYQTDLETKKELQEITRFVAMYGDCISSIESGEGFKSSLRKYIEDVKKNLCID